MIDAGVAEPIITLYTKLLEGAQGRKLSGLGEKRDASQRHQLSGTDSQLKTFIPDSEEVRQELAARRGAETRHQEEIARHQQTIETLRQELAAKSLKAAGDLSRRDGRIEELQNAYAHLDKLLHGEQEQRTKLFAEFERVRGETSEQLDRVRRETSEQLEAARRQADAVNHQLEDLRHRDEAARIQLARDEEELALVRQQLQQQSERDLQEITQLRERFVQTNELLQKNSIRLTDFEARNVSLTERLRKQLLEMKRLLRVLDQIDDAAALLRRSRRWKMANPFAALLAPITGKPLPGFGHLDKNVAKYRAWKESHPEAASLADEIQALRPREILPPALEVETNRRQQPELNPAVVTPPAPSTLVKFARPDEVEISIIIPVYNQVDFTHACLAAVQAHSGNIPYEVIVVDDASTDRTSEVIGAIPGLVYLRSETNSGFIAACNRGAAAARGSYLVFLNNDTTVTAGWLDALRETFTFAPSAGLVGSKLVYPDGRLQEAGGIIWRDGSGWNRGKFQNPAKPEYNYLREVDYCSAASVMIPKSLFDELGGFDRKYSPAYYEDTDLAFKVAQAGRKVLYQPLSVVIHYEGVTGGTDISTGTKQYQETNRGTFLSTWAAVLATKPENGDVIAYEALSAGRKRILVIDHHLPMPDRDSGSLRMFQILTLLQELGHRVTFIPDNLADIPPYADDLRKRGVEVVHHPHAKKISDYLESHGPQFDVVILSRCDFARKHIDTVRRCAPQGRIIFDTVDLHFLREDREAALRQNLDLKKSASVKQELEYELVEKADQTWVVSPVEQAILHAAYPEKSIEVVSNIVSAAGSVTPLASRSDILFIGSFQHPPNTDAVLYFARDILPLVQKQIENLKFYIIGDKAPPEVVALANEAIVVTGYQADVTSYFNRIKLSVAPLRYGAGIKGKVNQSMGLGVPVVATTIAVEGMALQDRIHALVADDPKSFADGIIELYQSEELWRTLSRNGVEKIQQSYSIDAARAQLQRLLADDGASLTVPQESLKSASNVELDTIGAPL
ncbi:MAG: glycosyltransferase [Chthoniobacterales bacterium]